MQTYPNGWAEAKSGLYRWESRVTIGGVEHSEGYIYELSISSALFSGGTVGIGGCVSKEIDLTVKPRGTIPRMAEIVVWIRPVADGITTDWLKKGVFYIDTRQEDATTGLLTIHGYDAMLKTERLYLEGGSSTETWPQPMVDVAYKIAERIGVDVDERSAIDPDITVGYPVGYTMRELLSHIAAANGGNWVMTDVGELRLVSLCESDDEIDLNFMVSSLEASPVFDPISRVTLLLDEASYTAGDNTGRAIEATCPWATQAMTNDLISRIRGYIYQPYSAQGTLLDPAAELGDTVVLGTARGCLASMKTTFGALCVSDIEAPADEEIDHEFPYEPTANREITRKFAQTRSEIKQTVDGITLSVTNDEDGTSSKFELKYGDAVLSSGNISFDGYATFTGLSDGTTVIDGGCIQTGTVLADLIKAGVLQSKDGGETFKLDLDRGTFSMRGSGQFQSSDGSSYIVVEGDELVLYAQDENTGEYLDKLRMGYISGPSPSGSSVIDYPYMMFGKSNTTEVGLIKKFVNGFWVGNSAPLNASGNFEGVDGAAGIFVNTKTGQTYAVEGTKMRNIYSAADGEMSITSDDVAHNDNPLSECMPVCLTLEEYQALVAAGKDNPNTPYLIKKEA